LKTISELFFKTIQISGELARGQKKGIPESTEYVVLGYSVISNLVTLQR
jgi:hypothetical protein